MRGTLIAAGTALISVCTAGTAFAQNALERAYPDRSPPPVLKRMTDRGIDLTYLGEKAGVPGFLARNPQGQYQIYYVIGDDHVIAGYLFNKRGRNLTAVQLANRNITLETKRDDAKEAQAAQAAGEAAPSASEP